MRVSRIGGRSGDNIVSVPLQIERMDAWATLHGVELTEPFEDLDRSGANTGRPRFQEALEEVRQGSAGGIVVVQLDRFAARAARHRDQEVLLLGRGGGHIDGKERVPTGR